MGDPIRQFWEVEIPHRDGPFHNILEHTDDPVGFQRLGTRGIQVVRRMCQVGLIL